MAGEISNGKHFENKEDEKKLNLFQKDPIITELERSLINYLVNNREVEKKVTGGLRRVRGLTFNIITKDITNTYFSVQIGIFEAMFNPINGIKERGNCYGIERNIRDWFERPSIQLKIKEVIKKQLSLIKKAG